MFLRLAASGHRLEDKTIHHIPLATESSANGGDAAAADAEESLSGPEQAFEPYEILLVIVGRNPTRWVRVKFVRRLHQSSTWPSSRRVNRDAGRVANVKCNYENEQQS